MKTILISTDFSANATHAAEYGYHLAKQVKGNIILCNAFVVPVEMPQAGMVVWPMYEYEEIVKDCANELDALKLQLEEHNTGEFRPRFKCISEAGGLQSILAEILDKNEVDIIVMGTHGNSGLSGFMLGNHSRRMIENTTRPLLLVPPQTHPKPVKRIAFASDIENVHDDLDAIYSVISLAKLLGAEVSLTYVFDEKFHPKKFEEYMDELVIKLTKRTHYPYISYHLIKNRTVETGLDWLCEHAHIDMLAMVHRPHNFFDSILKGSHTQKMASHIPVPLLVLPAIS